MERVTPILTEPPPNRLLNLFNVSPRPTKGGVNVTPLRFFPGSTKPQKDYAQSFQLIVSLSFTLFLTQKTRGQHLQIFGFRLCNWPREVENFQTTFNLGGKILLSAINVLNAIMTYNCKNEESRVETISLFPIIMIIL